MIFAAPAKSPTNAPIPPAIMKNSKVEKNRDLILLKYIPTLLKLEYTVSPKKTNPETMAAIIIPVKAEAMPAPMASMAVWR
jgi:hypothetical protein